MYNCVKQAVHACQYVHMYTHTYLYIYISYYIILKEIGKMFPINLKLEIHYDATESFQSHIILHTNV